MLPYLDKLICKIELKKVPYLVSLQGKMEYKKVTLHS